MRGRFTTSFADKKKAQYQADQLALLVPLVLDDDHRAAYNAGWYAGREALLAELQAQGRLK